MKITLNKSLLEFQQIPIVFHQNNTLNLFAKKNNKTLAETISKRHYVNLSGAVQLHYPNSMNDNLGDFLLKLKTNEDSFYLQFLNKYGDEVFCDFSIPNSPSTNSRGIYIFMLSGEVKYIGRSHDPFYKRVNQGYGHISPKNCYKDGQSTNCRVNSIIAKNINTTSFHVCMLNNRSEINEFEKLLITEYQPEWNILI